MYQHKDELFEQIIGKQYCFLIPEKMVQLGDDPIYDCRCVKCGKHINVSQSDLTQFRIRSCGCTEHSNIIGAKINWFTVLREVERDEHQKYIRRFECQCKCGNKKIRNFWQLFGQKDISCGCLKHHDIIGKKFGRLTVLRQVPDIRNCGQTVYECICSCGNPNKVYKTYTNLVNGRTHSCGCLKAESNKKFYTQDELVLSKKWAKMLQRCYKKYDNRYYRYGERGITVCDEWRDPEKGVWNFIHWALNNGYAPGLTIDRFPDNDGPYCPSNCRWSPNKEQANNRSTNHWFIFNKQRHTLAEWSDLTGISQGQVRKLVEFRTAKQRHADFSKGMTRYHFEKYLNILTKRKEPSMFTIGGTVDIMQPSYTVNFNTDSMFDLLSGSAARGYDGKFYLNAGLSPSLTGVCGRPGQFKSTFAASLVMRVAALYDTQVYIADSEDSVTRSIDRILRFGGNHSAKLNADYIVPIDATTEYDLARLLKLIQDIGEEKLKHRKEMTITTPFLDPKTGERVTTLLPTVMLVDSLSEMHGEAEDEMVSKLTLSDSKIKTAFMLDSNQKTIWMRHAKQYAAKYGIDLVLTAHYGQKLNLDSYLPPPKTLQWGSQSESSKGTGSKFNFLTANLCLLSSCQKLIADDKTCRYKLDPQTSPTDLSEVSVLMQRCKNNASGLMHPFVISQENGLLTDATDYNYLRQTGKGFSMTGNNINHQSVFLPDVSMTRNTFRGICQKDSKLTRALQLGAQLLYIQNNWSSAGWDFPIKVDPGKLADILVSDKNKMSADRILNSRGYWLPDELITSDTPEYMSIFDVLEFAHKNGLTTK